MELSKNKIKIHNTAQEMGADFSNLLFHLTHQFSQDFGSIRLGLDFSPELFPIYRNIFQDPTFPWSETEIFQINEKIQPPNLQKYFLRAFQSSYLSQVKELNLVPETLKKQEFLDFYEQKVESLDDSVLDVLIVYINEQGEFASYFQDSSFQASPHPIRINEAKKSQDLWLAFNPQFFLDAKYILAVAQSQEVLKKMLDENQTLATFPAKILLACQNLSLFTISQEFDILGK